MIASKREESTRISAVDLLATIPGLSALSEARLAEIATGVGECRAAKGEVVVREGEQDDRVFAVVNGSAEVTVSGEWGPRLLTVLRAGDSFGMLALFQPGGTRTATVTAQSDLHLLVLPGSLLRRIIEEDPAAAETLRAHATELLTANFLSRVGPFVGLDDEDRRRLAARVRSNNVATGLDVIRQGEIGESCYIVRSGHVKVVVERDGVRHEVGILGPGDVFGEAALLTASPRSATITTVEDTELFELDRAALAEVFARQKEVGAQFVRLMRLRERPRRRRGVQIVEQLDLAGEKITILKDPIRLHYFRLSERGRFVWDRLDGRSSVRELTLEYLRAFREFAPHAVTEIVAALVHAGFVEASELVIPTGESSSNRLARWAAVARGCLEWKIEVKGIDGALAAVYRGGANRLYSPIGLAGMTLVALVGIACVIAVGFRAMHAFDDLRSVAVPFAIGLAATILLHEAGHALTTKHFGRTVPYAGIGWYWFSPVVFIDTSDMWLGTRGQRMAVTAAGPCADLVAGAVPSTIACALPPGFASATLWLIATPFYLSFLLNLNPLLEYDGYYFVADYLDRPNLRRDSLAQLRRLLPQFIRSPSRARGHLLELLYGAATVLYVVLMAAVTLTLYRVTLAGWIQSVASERIASALAYVAAGAVVLLAGLAVIGDLRADTADRRSQA